MLGGYEHLEMGGERRGRTGRYVRERNQAEQDTYAQREEGMEKVGDSV